MRRTHPTVIRACHFANSLDIPRLPPPSPRRRRRPFAETGTKRDILLTPGATWLMGPDEGGSHVALGDQRIALDGGAETVPGTADADAAERRVEEELAARALAKSDLVPCRSMSVWSSGSNRLAFRRGVVARDGVQARNMECCDGRLGGACLTILDA